MFNTLEQFCNHTFLVDKQKAAMGKLEYKFVLEDGVLCIKILRNLDFNGQDAGGEYIKDPVSLKDILAQLRGHATVSRNNNNAPFWRAILKHQGISV